MTMKVTNDMILREIAGEHILIPVGETAIKVHGMISLSESGLLLWKKLQNDCTEADLLDTILSEYEIDQATAQQDVRAFLGKLNAIGILIQD